MRPRIDLQNILLGILPNVYFQPPANLQMTYPCIVYSRDKIDTRFSDNLPYNLTSSYTITLIDRDPDGAYISEVAALPACVHERSFVSDNLNHDVFRITF